MTNSQQLAHDLLIDARRAVAEILGRADQLASETRLDGGSMAVYAVQDLMHAVGDELATVHDDLKSRAGMPA